MFQSLRKTKSDDMNKTFMGESRSRITDFEEDLQHLSEGIKSGKDVRLDPNQYSDDVKKLVFAVNNALDSTSEQQGKKARFYLSILNSLPTPLSVTDLNENWTFINKTTEAMISVKCSDAFGRHCSNWGASICNTEKCGIKALRRGESESIFEQDGGYFKTLVSYLKDPDDKVIGHLETVVGIPDQVVVAEAMTEQINELALRMDSANEAMHLGMDRIDQMLVMAEEISKSSTHGSENIAQVVRVMEDLSASVSDTAELSKQISSEASQANEYAVLGMKQTERSGEVIEDITESTQMLEVMIKDINVQMVEIGKIVDFICDISDQTNLLALNAAIEAARAGDAGRGFAVVASEVKELAQNSRHSADNITHMISSLQKKIEKAEDAINQANIVAQQGKSSVEENQAMLKEIVTCIGVMNKDSLHIACFTEQQAAAAQKALESTSAAADQVQNTDDQVKDMSVAIQETGGAITKIGGVFDELHHITEDIHEKIAQVRLTT
jgi:methyl-accepting chemotaxis protein